MNRAVLLVALALLPACGSASGVPDDSAPVPARSSAEPACTLPTGPLARSIAPNACLTTPLDLPSSFDGWTVSPKGAVTGSTFDFGACTGELELASRPGGECTLSLTCAKVERATFTFAVDGSIHAEGTRDGCAWSGSEGVQR